MTQEKLGVEDTREAPLYIDKFRGGERDEILQVDNEK